MEFDLKEFKQALFEEASVVFPQIMEDLGHERIYSIALYNSGDDWCYLSPTVSTYAGLRQAAEGYTKNEFFREKSIPDLECLLKWSPCDSPHHGTYEESMPRTDQALRPLSDLMEDLYDEEEDDWSESYVLHDLLVDACIETLQLLDQKGVFGKDLNRLQITLNFLNGDQSNEERLERALRLNPASLCDRLAGDYEKASEVMESVYRKMEGARPPGTE